MKKLCNYVVWYQKTGRLKIGVTADMKKRMSYYAQESARHNLGEIIHFSYKPGREDLARFVERSICHSLKEKAIAGHREWFIGGKDEFKHLIKITSNFIVDGLVILKKQEFSYGKRV